MKTRMQRDANHFIGHLERYVFSLPYIQCRTVLDAGCKDGYGAHLLSAFAKKVTLADRNSKWLSMARNDYRYFCEHEFIRVDFDQEFPEGKWDRIVAFEVIEHVADADKFLKQISEHLTEKGLLIFSVPHMIENPDHKTLFDEAKIKEYVSRYFSIKEFYIQDKLGISGKPCRLPPISYVGIAEKL